MAMKITFNIDYATSDNQVVELVLSGGAVFSMTNTDGHHQRVSVELQQPGELIYCYRVRGNLGLEASEFSRLPHRITIDKKYDQWTVEDCWQYIPWDKNFYSKAIGGVFFARNGHIEPTVTRVAEHSGAITFQLYAPQVAPQHYVVITGDAPELGAWNPKAGIRLGGQDFPRWSVTISSIGLPSVFQYKFVIMDSLTGEVVKWENGANRELHAPAHVGEHKIIEGLHFAMQPSFRFAGVAVPLFSLRGEQSWGVGDFGDLKAMVDFAAASGMRVVQLLPITDTTATHTEADSYPYNSISAFALNPIYMAPMRIGVLKDYTQMEYYTLQAAKLNASDMVDYAAADELKWAYFKEIYNQTGKQTLESEEFVAFFENNKEWLMPYAVFCYLREKYRTADFSKWKELSAWDSEAAMALCHSSAKSYKQVAFHYFLQYHLHLQLLEAANYARSRGVVLKGDLPIGVSAHSVEVWANGDLFNIGMQAGAPPDDFAVLGQNWGFPTYNYQAMRVDNYQWFKSRLTQMSKYFDAYRIDHILGFFRIWQIPQDAVTGLLGQFSPALGFSTQELDTVWGMPMYEQRYTTPYIHRVFLYDHFGEHVSSAMKYLDSVDSELFTLKAKCNTQQKIKELFRGDDSPKGKALMHGLMRLAEEVLFVRDANDCGLFHPRIMAQNTYSYAHLYDWEKERFDALYQHYYYHRHNDFWAQSALEKLPVIIDSTDMLCCGEDLGMIPSCVGWVMDQIRILTLELERMPKNPQDAVTPAAGFPYRSVCTTSTHDMSSLRMWWRENAELTQRYYNQILMLPGEAPAEATAGVCSAVIEQHLGSSSQFCILPLCDWLSMFEHIRAQDPSTERINDPSNPNHVWNYRMHLDMEQLMDSGVAQKINRLIALSGR